MIVLRVTRTEDDGTETELGEVRMLEVGVVSSHIAKPDGVAVVSDMVERLRGGRVDIAAPVCPCGDHRRSAHPSISGPKRYVRRFDA